MVIVEMVHDTPTPGDREICFHILRTGGGARTARRRRGAEPSTTAGEYEIGIGRRPRPDERVRVRDPAGLWCRVYAVSAGGDCAGPSLAPAARVLEMISSPEMISPEWPRPSQRRSDADVQIVTRDVSFLDRPDRLGTPRDSPAQQV